MLIRVQNLTGGLISTDVGSVQPFSSLSAEVSAESVYSVTTQLNSLQASGRITYTAAESAQDIKENETTKAVNLYVETTGSDANPGTQAAPFKTIQAALDSLPKTIKHPVNVNIGIGNFAGAYVCGFTLSTPANATTGAYLNIVGTMVAPALTSGSTSGTFTSGAASSGATLATATLTGAGWTVNDLRGRFVEITAGTGVGQIKVIQSNTVDTISVMGGLSPVPNNTSVFRIIEPGSVITTGVTAPKNAIAAAPTSINGLLFYSNDVLLSSSPSSSSMSVRNVKTTTATGIRFEGLVRAFVQYCVLTSTTNGIYCVNGASVSCSTIAAMSSGSSYGLAAGGSVGLPPGMSVQSSLLYGGAGGLIHYGGSYLLMTSTAIEAFTGAAIWLYGIGMATQCNGLRIDGGGLGGVGVRMLGGFTTSAVGLTFGGDPGYISNCSKAFDVLGQHNVMLSGIWSGTGNTTVFLLSKGANVSITAASTITGTTEVSMDGTVTTLAAMRASTPKLISNDYGTRIFE